MQSEMAAHHAAAAAANNKRRLSPIPSAWPTFESAQTSAHSGKQHLSLATAGPGLKRSNSAPRSPTPNRPGDARPQSYRVQLASRPVWWIAGLVLFMVCMLWVGGVARHSVHRSGAKVVARDFEEGPLERIRRARGVGGSHPADEPDEVVLILCPMKDSIEHIWHFFHMLDTLTYPRHLLQIAILVSDTTDRTYQRALELADERQYTRNYPGGPYDRISVFNKDFRTHGELVPGGADRHKFEVQVERRKLMARSRTWLLNSAIRPEVDWVVWMDVDIVDYEETLIQDLMSYAEDEQGDVVVPNCVWKTYNEQGSYDRNNWQETPASIAFKSTLSPEDVLLEGYQEQLNTHRLNMADLFPPTDSTPETMLLDGVGGCTALVRAGLHRQGAIFPAFPVDHQLETEGFAQMAKLLGARLIGLPKVYVYHGLYG